jgi:serine/threonine-protein kinase
MTAAALRRGLPMWAVAVASGLVALMFVGIIYAILASTSSPPKTVTSATPSGSASPPGSGLAGSVVAPPGTGPFGVARAAFSQTIIPPPKPTAMLAPTTPPVAPVAPTQSAASATTPVTTAPTTAPTTPATTAASTAQARPTPIATPRVEKEATGLLTIICKPACDQVFDNGRPLGTSPIFRAPVPVGEHRLQLKTNSPPVNKVITVYIVRDDLKVVPVTMTP